MSTVERQTTMDLRDAYLFTFDEFAADPSGFAEGYHHGLRYARELFGTLSSPPLNLLEAIFHEDIGDMWQVANRPEDRSAALAVLDDVLPLPEMAKVKAQAKSAKPRSASSLAVNASADRVCICGCATPVGPRSNYRPGHDARHAGQVARDFVDANLTGDVDPATVLEVLPSPALKEKARKIAAGLLVKLEKKNPGVVQLNTTPDESWSPIPPMKVGRWEYPARQWSGPSRLVQRNEKRDGSGRWLDVPAPSTPSTPSTSEES